MVSLLRNLAKKIYLAGFLAYKNIVFNKKTFFLILSIIGLTYLSGIFIGAVLNGLNELIVDKMIDANIGNIVIVPKDNEQYIYDVSNILSKLDNIPGIVGASPHYIVPVTIKDKNNNVAAINLVVVDPERERMVSSVPYSIIEGRYLSKNTLNGIVVGAVVVKKYSIYESIKQVDVSAGDMVYLQSPLGSENVKVLGIYSVGVAGSELYGYINKQQLENYFGIDLDSLDIATEIVIKTSEKGKEDEIVSLLRMSGINAEIRTWEEQLGTISQFTDSLMIMNRIALVVSIVVAFGIIYIMMYINALQKMSQLGILKAIGISGDVIVLSYVFQSFVYGVSGVVAGVVMSYLLVYYFTYFPIAMPFGDVVPVLQKDVMSYSAIYIVIVSILAGYFASSRVVKNRILEMIFRG